MERKRRQAPRHAMPSQLEAYLDEYIAAAGILDEAKGPLFRSAIRRTGVLAMTPMNRIDAYRMIRRRAAEAGFEAGGTLENARAMAAHESPRTTKLYDRTSDAVTLDEVERIKI
jgi:hypothetical protein